MTNKLLDHFFVGGDKFFNDFFGNLNVDAFPRFNVVHVADQEYRVDLALPGWSKNNVKIHFDIGLLTIEGNKVEGSETYIHKGISSKAFRRSFFVPKNLEVTDASFENGLLCITFKPRAINPAKYIEIK
jgi:molecular chaperone IbpA